MIKIFKSQNSDIIYIETVGETHAENVEYIRDGDLFTIDRINTRVKDVNRARYDVFVKENGDSFVDADDFELFLTNSLNIRETLDTGGYQGTAQDLRNLILDRLIVSTVTNNTTNINNANYTDTPVFGINEIINDDGSFTNISPTQQRVNFDGWIEVNVNVSYRSTAQRATPEGRLAINGALVGASANTGYIRSQSGHNESSLHLSGVYLQVSNGDLISFQLKRESNSGASITQQANEGQISIKKVKTI